MKKIMFNDKYGLTAAVLNGWKTQTRRIVPDKLLLKYGHNKHNDRRNDIIRDAPFIVGEVVAVAQCYEDAILDVGEEKWNKRHKWYNINYLCHEKGLHNKMFVRADLMPHRILIENVKVERVQDISYEDAMAEGIFRWQGTTLYHYDRHSEFPENSKYKTYYDAFGGLIDKTCGKGTWAANPWVFCYEFKLVK